MDWIAITLRWLSLLALAVTMAQSGYMAQTPAILLMAASLWNICLTLLVAFGRRIGWARFLTQAADLALAGALFWYGGDLVGSVGWAGVLPVTTASVYFGWRGGLLFAVLSLVVQGVLALIFNSPVSVGVFIGTIGPLYLAMGLVLGIAAGQVQKSLSSRLRQQQAARRESERLERERNQSIYKLVSALNATLNYQRVLDTALDLGYSTLAPGSQTDERMVSSALLYMKAESGAAELRVGSARRFTAPDMRISLPGTSGLLGQTIDDGEAKLQDDISGDPELGRVVALRSCTSAYCIPLRSGLETFGVLLYAHPDPDYFTSDRREILDIIGSQAIVALQNARLYQHLEQEKERMTEIQEEARKKLARDLHDGPTQSVAALAMRANFARRLMERDAKAAADELYKIEDLARRTTKEIRHMLFTLRPLVLESQGLIAALQSMAEKMRETYSQNVIIDADSNLVSDIEVSKQGVVFYIAEEAVNNARKHARAAHIWVRLKPAGDQLVSLEIEDDGVGFSPEVVGSNYDRRDSLGMVNMRERTELVNGVLQIDSAPEQGTRIKVLIPLSEDAADRIRRGL